MSTKAVWRMGAAFALLGILVLLAGCAGGEDASPAPDVNRSEEATIESGDAALDAVALGAEDDGSQVELAAGQVLEVTLESNPTTGYGWEVSEVDGAVLAQEGEAQFQEAPTEGEQVVGAGGVQTFRFTASPGETTLTLVYRRSWEKDVDPLETFTVQVTVR